MSAVRQINTLTTQDLRQALERKRAELRRAIGHRDEISIVRAADVIDALQLSQERTLAIEHLDLDTHLLREVETALDRMEEAPMEPACTATTRFRKSACGLCRGRFCV